MSFSTQRSYRRRCRFDWLKCQAHKRCSGARSHTSAVTHLISLRTCNVLPRVFMAGEVTPLFFLLYLLRLHSFTQKTFWYNSLKIFCLNIWNYRYVTAVTTAASGYSYWHYGRKTVQVLNTRSPWLRDTPKRAAIRLRQSASSQAGPTPRRKEHLTPK